MDGSRPSASRDSRLSRSTGKMVVCPCPHPPPVDKTMMARYGKLESTLQKNWATLHEADEKLRDTRSSASTEVGIFEEMKQASAKEALDGAELEEAQQAQVREWLARTLEKSLPTEEAQEAKRLPKSPGESWTIMSRDHLKEPCSPITQKHQAEARWKYLFGDLGVAYASPGTGWTAYSDRRLFSHSSSYLGMKCGDVFDLAIRAKNLGPVSSITLPDELKKRLTRMQSMGKTF
eukprot:CAMPEP_0181470128 /NCGR_PEP_ID=MMETSP1110-20121109/38389_1 /TAXON_ID=174948 /ORGANISM="Symbiodinium sp., Strain CCMP421" /LENGTH=233 /DNA_ID=CAMNT_0023595085 /DNA_START=29 /DNA_END=730 /DNA_ORIENTATION=+